MVLPSYKKQIWIRLCISSFGLFLELPPKDTWVSMHRPPFASNICVKGMHVPHLCRAVGILLILNP